MKVHLGSVHHNILIICALLIVGCQDAEEYTGTPPGEALSTFELHPDFEIELVASEPAVSDPVDMVIDEHGRLFVLEMHGYPDDRSGTDRIMMLNDTNGDGRMDESTVFADSLVLPMGIMRWKDGLLVAESPDVAYLEDTDGDGTADKKQTILTGFHTYDSESDVNNPRYGLDNWIYLANGPTSDTSIRYADDPDGPEIPREATNRNIRFRPDQRKLEAQSSRTQFGFSFDTWGHQFLVNNRNHIYQEVIASRYLDRNPDLLVTDATESLSDHGSAAQVFPITTNPNPQLLTDVGEITAACGITFYQGGAFPSKFNNVSFVAEPAHNLVHADRLQDDGATFVASRLRPNTEFLASTDAWFRPVNMKIGPDGALYVTDYYRQIIEGPEWLSDEVLESGDIFNGSEMGRIYRITPKETAAGSWTAGLELGDATSEELVRRLDAPNIWWRRTAQRLLVQRNAKQVTPALIEMAQDTESTSAPGRLHALWTLEGLDGLPPELLRQALHDPDGGVRENAIRLAENHWEGHPGLRDDLFSLRSDPNPKVRYQLLLTLGYIETPEAAQVRQQLLFDDVGDKWMQIAALSAAPARYAELLEMVTDDFQPEYSSFARRLADMIGASQEAASIRQLYQRATAPVRAGENGWKAPVLTGLAQGLQKRDAVPSEVQEGAGVLVDAFFDHSSPSVRQASLEVLEVAGLPDGRPGAETALQIAGDPSQSPDRRAQALTFVRLADPAPHTSFLEDLIIPSEPTPVQVAALRALGTVPGTTVSEYALEQWSVMTPEVRKAALGTFLSRPFKLDRIKLLLGAIENGTVQPAHIDWPNKVTLMRDIPETLKKRARDLLARAEEEREEEIEQYVETFEQKTPNPEQGRTVFQQQCASCHGLGTIEDGVDLGPDLMTVRGWSPAEIVDHTLRPDKAVADEFALWQVTLQNGETRQGIIASETANAVTLRNQGGSETTIPRGQIESIRNMDASIMPSNFDDRITPQEMADLVSFIRTAD